MVEYLLIQKFYEGKSANNSKLPYMKHIDDGLVVLAKLTSTDLTKKAWCLHALIQSDEDLKANFHLLKDCDPQAVALALEYRHAANSYTSHYRTFAPVMSPLKEVEEMLIADKVQNYFDLQTHNKKHPYFEDLTLYFKNWFNVLRLSPKEVKELSKDLK